MADAALTEEQHAAVLEARKALARSIERRYPPRLARALVAVAIAAAFSDMARASIASAELIAVINGEIVDAGLELRWLPRN
jgi:hypothetical protein